MRDARRQLCAERAQSGGIGKSFVVSSPAEPAVQIPENIGRLRLTNGRAQSQHERRREELCRHTTHRRRVSGGRGQHELQRAAVLCRMEELLAVIEVGTAQPLCSMGEAWQS